MVLVESNAKSRARNVVYVGLKAVFEVFPIAMLRGLVLLPTYDRQMRIRLLRVY